MVESHASLAGTVMGRTSLLWSPDPTMPSTLENLALDEFTWGICSTHQGHQRGGLGLVRGVIFLFHFDFEKYKILLN